MENPNQDLQQLNLLSIFHYVVAAITALFACFPIIHLVVGIGLLISGFDSSEGDAPPAFVGWLFIIIAICFIAAGWTLAILIAVAGKRLSLKVHYKYCLIIAAIECIFMPFGTILGILTIIVLSRPSVKQIFGVS